jgi:hypothetical protein
MSYPFRRPRIFIASILLPAALLACVVAQHAFAQGTSRRPSAPARNANSETAKPPIKKDALFDALRIKGLTTTELVTLVKERGVDFQMTSEDEKELRAAGARPALIEAIRGSHRGATEESVSPADTLPPVDSTTIELAFWNSIKDSDEPEEFKAYLKKYPDGQFAILANNRLQKLEETARPQATPQTKQTTTDSTATLKGLRVLIVYIDKREKDARKVADRLRSLGVAVEFNKTDNEGNGPHLGKIYYVNGQEDKAQQIARLVGDIEIVSPAPYASRVSEESGEFSLWIVNRR